MKFFNKIKLNSSGITLMEVMISVMILSVGIVGSIGLVSSSMSKFSSATNKIIATNLAQDGIERVRNVRDSNWRKEAADWKANIEGENPSSQTVRFFCGDVEMNEKIPSSPADLAACGSACQVYIYSDGTNQCYSDNYGAQTGYARAATNFYRLITVEEVTVGSVDHLDVTVNVKWTRNGQSYYLSPLKESLYNWKGTP